MKAELPGVKREDVQVTPENGVLEVHVPKLRNGKTKPVEIKVQ